MPRWTIRRDPKCTDCGKQLTGNYYGNMPACSRLCMMRTRWKRAKAKGDTVVMERIEKEMKNEPSAP